MKDRQPWSVRGVTREARAKAARAASHRHMTIGEWVTQTLIAAADRDLGLETGAADGAQSTSANLPARPAEQQRELTQALGALVRYLENTAQSNDLTRRLERTEHVLMGRIEQMAAGLYSLMQTMETRGMPVIDAESGATRLMLPDQSRLAAAVERIVDAEGRRQDQMDAVAEALTMLAAKVGDNVAPAVGESEVEEDEAGEAVEPLEPHAPTWSEDDAEPLVLDDEVTETEDIVEEADDAGEDIEEGDRTADDGASEETRPSMAASTAAWLAEGRRDESEDVVATIRARRVSDEESDGDGAKRGFFGRLFRRE